MGTYSSGGVGGLIERGVAGRAGDIGSGIVDTREKTGFGAYNYGSGLTDEGLGGLRGMRGEYRAGLKDPLGEVGRGIFARARGNLADDFARTVNSGSARARQLAAQSGGSLTPEQITALDRESRNDAAEGKFRSETDLSIAEGGMALSELGKLRDRIEGIDRTITVVGQDEKKLALSSVLESLRLGIMRNKYMSEESRAWVGMFMGKSGGSSAGPLG